MLKFSITDRKDVTRKQELGLLVLGQHIKTKKLRFSIESFKMLYVYYQSRHPDNDPVFISYCDTLEQAWEIVHKQVDAGNSECPESVTCWNDLPEYDKYDKKIDCGKFSIPKIYEPGSIVKILIDGCDTFFVCDISPKEMT